MLENDKNTKVITNNQEIVPQKKKEVRIKRIKIKIKTKEPNTTNNKEILNRGEEKIKFKTMNIQKVFVSRKEYNKLKSSNSNDDNDNGISNAQTAADLVDLANSSCVSVDVDNGNIEKGKIESDTTNIILSNSLIEKNLSFKNKLVKSLYKKFQRRCSIDEALKFFKSNKVLASYFDDNFWAEILQVINLDNCTIEKLVKFKQNVVKLVNDQVGLFDRKMEPEKIKFAISPNTFQKLIYNDSLKTGFIDYLDGKECQKSLDSFRILLDGSNDDLRRESCGRLLDIILGNLEDNCQPVQDVIGLLEICRILLGCKTIPVNVDGWKKIFTKIESLSIKDFLNIHSLLDYPKVDLDDLEKFLFSKLDSNGDTQDEVKQFINMFFPNDQIKNDELDSRLYVFKLFISSFPNQKLDFSFVENFAQKRLGLELSGLSIERLLKLLSKVKSSSINSNTFKVLVELVKGKNIVLGTHNGVDELRQLLCDVLRISGKELGFSNVMDLFLLYPKMPEFCTKSTLTNESLKLALTKIKKINALGFNNKNLTGNRDEFRSKFKKFIDLFKDGPNKITFDNFKNLILAVPDDYLDFDCLNYILQKTNVKNNEMELFKFFETTLLTKISKYKFDLSKVRAFFDNYLSGDTVKNYKFDPDTFKLIIKNVINPKDDYICENEDVQWLLEKCCEFNVQLDKSTFISLIKKGKIDEKKRIDWQKMYQFIDKIVQRESWFCFSEKIEFNENEISAIHERSNFGFDSNDLGVFIENIITLKKFVTDKDKLFEIVLSHIPCGGLSDLNMFRKIVYYCFTDVENYNSDMQIPVAYCHKIDSKLYNKLLKTFKNNSLSYDDFKTLSSNFFGEQRSDSLFDLLFGLFNENKTNANVSNIDHAVLRKKLKSGTLSNEELGDVFSKFGDKKLPKDNFVEILMLAEDNALTKGEFIALFQKYCKDRIETENNDDMLNKIASKISGVNKDDLRNCLTDLNVEKGIEGLLNDIKEDFSVLFKLTNQKLKGYGLSTLLNQGDQENNRRNNRQENVVDSNDLQLNQNNGEANSNNVIQGAQNAVVGVIENLDEGMYSDRMSITDFKIKYPDFWNRLSKEEKVYIQMILGHKQSLLLTVFCLLLSALLFVPCSTVCYFFGVFLIVYFLLKLTSERTRNVLTKIVQGKEPNFLDKLFVWNGCINDALVLRKAGKLNNVNNNNDMKNSILDVMLPNRTPSFSDTASSLRNTAFRVLNSASTFLNRNVL